MYCCEVVAVWVNSPQLPPAVVSNRINSFQSSVSVCRSFRILHIIYKTMFIFNKLVLGKNVCMQGYQTYLVAGRLDHLQYYNAG